MAVNFLLYNRHPLTNTMLTQGIAYENERQKVAVVALAFFATVSFAVAGLVSSTTLASLVLVVSVLVPIMPFRDGEGVPVLLPDVGGGAEDPDDREPPIDPPGGGSAVGVAAPVRPSINPFDPGLVASAEHVVTAARMALTQGRRTDAELRRAYTRIRQTPVRASVLAAPTSARPTPSVGGSGTLTPEQRRARIRQAMDRREIRYSGGSLSLSLDFLKNNPLLMLQFVCEYGIPSRVTFLRVDRSGVLRSIAAIDAGGLRRQFLGILMEAVSNTISKTSGAPYLPYIPAEGDLPPSRVNQLEMYNRLGNLYSKILARSGEGFVTGHIFDPCFVQMLAVCAREGDHTRQMSMIANIVADKDPHFTSVAALLRNPADASARATVAAIFACEEHEAEAEACKAVSAYHLPCMSILAGGGEAFERRILASRNLHVLAHSIQGQSISKSALLGALVNNNAWSLSQASARHFSWLQEMVRESDEEWRRKFVFAASGQSVLPVGQRIKINPTRGAGGVVAYHTCFYEVDLPGETIVDDHRRRISLTKEKFKELVNFSLEGCDGFSAV